MFEETIRVLVVIVGMTIFLLMLYTAWVSSQENEPRAARIFFIMAFLGSIPFLGVGLIHFNGQVPFAITILAITILGITIFTLPIGKMKSLENDIPKARIDERDIMFSRNLLQPSTDRYDDYYRSNPDKKELDEKFREKPGLGQPGASFYDPISSAATEASFKTVAALHTLIDRQPEKNEPVRIQASEMAQISEEVGKKIGGCIGRHYRIERLPQVQRNWAGRTIWRTCRPGAQIRTGVDR